MSSQCRQVTHAGRPRRITAEAFRKYGRVIEWPGPENPKSVNQWRIVVRDRKAEGWRIACLVVREQRIKRLEQHPESWESFEPLTGRAVLFVATGKRPRQYEAFFLDKPVVLRKGIWHAIVAVGREAQVKITENNRVTSRFFRLGCELSLNQF